MEACIIPVASRFHPLKKPFLPNIVSPPPFCTSLSSSNFHRQKSYRVKPISGLRSSQGRSIGLEERRLSPWVPKLEDLDPTNMLLRQRIVFLCSEVNDTSADFIISQLLLLDAENSMEDIKFFINSPGGSVTAGMGIYDTMKLCKADVSTICFGLAASMGAFLLAAGTKGKRFCMPNSKVMIHQPYGGGGGSATEMALQDRELKYHKIKFEKIYSRITGKTQQQIEEDTSYDKFLSAREAVEYGIADGIMDEGKAGVVAPIGDPTTPPRFGLWHYFALYDTIRPLPCEENLVKKQAQAAEETKHSSEVKKRKKWVYDVPYQYRYNI